MKQTIQVDLNRWLEKKEGGRGLDGATSSGIRIDNTWPVGNQSDFICCRLLSDVIRLSRRNIPTIPHPFNFDQLNDVTISSKCFNFVENEMKSIDNFFFHFDHRFIRFLLSWFGWSRPIETPSLLIPFLTVASNFKSDEQKIFLFWHLVLSIPFLQIRKFTLTWATKFPKPISINILEIRAQWSENFLF